MTNAIATMNAEQIVKMYRTHVSVSHMMPERKRQAQMQAIADRARELGVKLTVSA